MRPWSVKDNSKKLNKAVTESLATSAWSCLPSRCAGGPARGGKGRSVKRDQISGSGRCELAERRHLLEFFCISKT